MFDVDSAAMFGSTQFLITGGTGFIGRHVVRRLLAQGAGVRVFCRTPEKAQRLFGDRVGIARGDLCDRASVAAAIAGYHYTLIKARTREGCFRAFLHNNWIGLAVFLGIVADTLMRK